MAHSNRKPQRRDFATPAFCGRRKWKRLLGRPPKVLIAEDDRDLLLLIAEWFSRDGWRTWAVEDGSEFFQQVEPILGGESPDAGFDLIITDIVMPGIEVMEILEGIRTMESTIPLVGISGSDDPELPARVERLEPARFFSKPFTIEDLHETSRYLLLASQSENNSK